MPTPAPMPPSAADPFASRHPVEKVIDRLHALATIGTGNAQMETPFQPDLSGYAALSAVSMLINNWEMALKDGNTDPLLEDVDQVISHLQVFRAQAQAVLPLDNGGLGGVAIDEWVRRLDAIGISIYEAEDYPDHYGYSGCDVDCYGSEADAVTAAVLEHKDALDEIVKTHQKPALR